MANDDHQKIIETVLELVRRQLRENGALDFSVLMLDEQGKEGRIDVDLEFFRSDATKDRLTRELRRDFREKGIVRYALVAECWMGHVKPIPLVAARSENLAHYLTRYVDEYRRRGYSPREGGGRDEIVLIQVCDRLRTTLRIWKIDRFPLTGAVRDLVPVDTGSAAETGFAGRFVNLLDRASCFGSAQHLEPTTEAVIARRRYWLHVMPRSANALC
jgi:hypothetical protein